jgi:hypothetical protein
MQMNGHLSEYDEKAITDVFLHEKNAGIIGGYCEDGFPLYYANDKMAKMLGYPDTASLAEGIGGMVANTIHPDDMPQVQKDLTDSYYEGQTYETTYRMLRKDGSWFWTVDKGKVIRTDDGRLAIVSICNDMTDFVRRQKELEQQNFLSESMFKNLPEGYHRCSCEKGFPFLYVSDRFLNILGWTEEDIRTRFDNKYMNLVHPDDRQLILKYCNTVIREKGTDNYADQIYRLLGKDGYHWVSDTTIFIAAGGRTFFQGIISDITKYMEDKEKGERALEAALSSANLKNEVISAVSTLFLQIYVVDLAAERYDRVNTDGVKYGMVERGGHISEMADIGINRLASPEYHDVMAEFLDFDTLADRLADKNSVYTEMKDFNGKWYSVNFIVQSRDENGKVTRVLYVVSDINDRKTKELEYEEKLVNTLQEVKRADIAKSDFLRRMSHDIRTPINGIRGMLEIANHFPENMEKQAECRRKIGEASGYLLSLVNNVLDMNKLESGKVILENKRFDIIDMLKKSNSVAEINASEHCIAFNVDESKLNIIHRNVIGSPVHLQQILLNMTNNAVKYNRENGSITVYTTEEPKDSDTSMYTFVCSDTGIGMNEDFIKHAFEPFSQEERSENSSFGSGLGLSIVKELVERMGGKIDLQSKVNEGTYFSVSVPLKIDRDVSGEKSDSTVRPTVDMHRKMALLVEDNELNMEIAEFLLEGEGMIVVKASNGKEAVEKFAASEVGGFDIIFMDVMMPVMNGLDAARKIRSMTRADAQTIPVIAMTANAFQDDVQRSFEVGMNAHITKPLDINKIREAITDVMTKSLSSQAKIDATGFANWK